MPVRRFTFCLCLSASLMVLAAGCSDNRITSPAAPASSPTTSIVPTIQAGEEKVDLLAKGLALALGNTRIRNLVRDALRDSPFHSHAIDLRSFLHGDDGRLVTSKAATALGISTNEFLMLADSIPNLELVMPRTLDRVSWEGGPEIDVTAVAINFRQRQLAKRVSERGYDVSGNARSVQTLQYSARPYLIVRPAERGFPADPEALRIAAPKRQRNSITTPLEERASMRERGIERVAKEKQSSLTNSLGEMKISFVLECGYPDSPPDCDTPPPQFAGGGGSTLSSEMGTNYCYGVSPELNATTDRDNDLINDNCESAFASAFAPLLNIGDRDRCPARQPYWAASRHPDRPNNVQLIFALAYLCDGGYGLYGIGGHSGDSEWIILEVKSLGGSVWGVVEATLSAHFGAEEGVAPGQQSGADTYAWQDMDFPQGPFPRIWSALDKHSNYRNRAACESGNWLQDSCGGDYLGTQIVAPASRNLGNYYHVPFANRTEATKLLDCTNWEGASYANGVNRSGIECFWSQVDSRFSGWDPAKPDDVTPYRKIFAIFEF